MKSSIVLMLILSAQSCWAGNNENLPPLQTVAQVDLSRYTGLWYQVALIPNRFQKNCTLNTTATYGLNKNGNIDVLNECTKPNGKRKSIQGSAKIIDPVSHAKLGVKFFWFQPRADYWIIELGSEYEYAMVGTPNRKYLWILSRTPTIDPKTYAHLLDRAQAQQFDTSKVESTQPTQDSTL
jgi:apolipoprotein D and lipocalin family protein